MKKALILVATLLSLAACGSKTQQTRQTEEPMNKDFLTLATERYSVRHFSDAPVEQEKIDLIIEAGRVAPTAVNSQPQKIYVAKSPEVMAKLNKVSPCMYGAQQCFIMCYNDDTVCKRGENGNYGEIDATIVLTHMMLQAAELGIGTCMVGYFKPDELCRELNLPETIHPVLLMPFGYAAEDAAPSPKHSEYRPIGETVEVI